MSAGPNWSACTLFLCVSAAAVGADNADDATIAAQPVYEDRLIDGGNLPADVSVGLESQRSAGGWPRAFRVQATTSRVTRNDVNSDESGVQLGGMLDTPNHGALSLEANLRTSAGRSDSSGDLFSLHQIGLPMNGGWLVNNSLGATNAPAVDLARSQYRFFVPVMLSNGATTEWRNADHGLQLHGSVGQPGLLTGIYVPTFEDLGGRQASAGVQWGNRDGWSAALQATDVEDVQFGIGPLAAEAEISSQSWFGAVGWGTSGTHVQLNLIESATDDQSGQAGAWIDAVVRQGRTQHNFGAFHLEPDLVWGNLALTSNLEGGYYRAAFQNRQWTLDGGVDYVVPVSGGDDSTIFGTGYGRYQVSSRLGLGGGVNLRHGGTDAWSTFGFVDNVNRLGIGRAQLEYATDDFRDNTQLTLNQTWNTPPGTRLGSSLFLGHEQIDDVGANRDLSANRIGVAMNGGGDLRSNLAFDVDARWDTSDGRSSYDNVLASAALNWAFAAGWTMSGNYYVSRNSWRTPFEVSSPIPGFPSVIEQRSDDEGFFVSVRYQWQAGSRPSALGGGPGRGSGSVSGALFLDENDNGRFDAGEVGAPNVVVLLNGRFAARTNAQGRFEFPAVAAGAHVLSVVQDNLPLPWTVPADGRTSINVGVRGETHVTIAARRLR